MHTLLYERPVSRSQRDKVILFSTHIICTYTLLLLFFSPLFWFSLAFVGMPSRRNIKEEMDNSRLHRHTALTKLSYRTLTFIYFFARKFTRERELRGHRGRSDFEIFHGPRRVRVYMYVCVCVCICMYVCACVCICVHDQTRQRTSVVEVRNSFIRPPLVLHRMSNFCQHLLITFFSRAYPRYPLGPGALS